ncbi:MAG: DUF4956 domain-containing protein [Lachnospiraceae bacterium]|nr:DUF4956 domain-containing protein [Lachnospiraceae bacterium]
MFTNVLKTADTTATTGTVVSEGGALLCIGVAIILGLIISLVYIFSDKKKKYSAHFAFTLALLPSIVCVVIMVVGSDIARAISLGGVFALVRFRSVPGDSKDITNVFYAMVVGLTAGMGYVTLAIMVTVIIGALYFVLNIFQFGARKSVTKQLRITIPENLNFNGAFDDLFNEYATSFELERVKTTNLGTLYELTYAIDMKTGADEKQFIDAIRCRNGNLNIILCKMPEKLEQL